MRILLNSLRTGATSLVDAPAPRAGRDQLVIGTIRTLVSAGTERMIVEFGKGSLLAKARSQPDKVRQVIVKMRTEGVLGTLDAVRSKLDEPVQLGYSNVGRVLDAGPGVTGLSVGDRVVSNAPHAEIVRATKTMVARVPDAVADDTAAFAVVGAIGLQGIRLAQPTLGETVAVYGLGLIGLMTVQLLIANGCRVIGIDIDPAKCRIAEAFGAEPVNLSAGEDAVERAVAFSRGRGVDAVIITAATKSDALIHDAAAMCRKRGRIVLTGVTGLNLSRDDFYKKELSFQVSASYGPGRYDPAYEEQARDYPLAFVRWTQQRNIEAVLDMMAEGRIDVAPLISHRFAFERADEAYALLTSGEPSLGILLDYADQAESPQQTLRLPEVQRSEPLGKAGALAVIGAGNYASRVLIPAFKAAGGRLGLLVNSGGSAGPTVARRFGFSEISTDAERAFADPAIGTVVVATRHDSHAGLVLRSLESGKHVFVEKPLCLTLEELERIEACYRGLDAAGEAPVLTVGFNRRFAPMVIRLAEALGRLKAPKCFVMTVNAGPVPGDHWTQDDSVGGGRIVGEACHFIDLLRHLAGAPITVIDVIRIAPPEPAERTDDKASITLSFADGSIGTVHYFANGNNAVPKERLEVFAGGRVYQLDNFRTLVAHGDATLRRMRSLRPDKGQSALVEAFLAAANGGSAPIPVDQIFEVARASILAAGMARRGTHESGS